jgi:hypothetical protein
LGATPVVTLLQERYAPDSNGSGAYRGGFPLTPPDSLPDRFSDQAAVFRQALCALEAASGG